uniref:ATP synthase F0 subunit 8 n=1 Tax=Anodonta exulcerata TaxID=2030908 RepID=A0A7U0FPQ4_9BIVA|nr:ATP synthase F0 subunit 8 [Anodonta exulcerata]QQV69686.1 ATP synthase F0 subunit 8 [Anodonta exulcerata]
MPQLSPMSWVMVIMVFLTCLILFAVSIWWLVEGKYLISYSGGKIKGVLGKKYVKWGFGSSLLK